MATQKIEDWENKKSALKKDYPQLTHDDLMYEIGKEEELLERLQKKLKKDQHEIRKWLHLMG